MSAMQRFHKTTKEEARRMRELVDELTDKRNLCPQCGEEIGYLSTAHLTIVTGMGEFCSGSCWENFMDEATEEHAKRKLLPKE